MILLSRLLILSFLYLSSVGIFSLKFTLPRLIEVLLFCIVLFLGKNIRPVQKSTLILMRLAFCLIIYKFIVDNTIHIGLGFNRIYETFFFSIREIFVVCMLPVFERIGSDYIRPIKVFLFGSIPLIIFGYIQIINPNINLPNILPNFGVLVFPDIGIHLIEGQRVIGSFDRAIPFALLLSMLCLIALSIFFFNSSLKFKIIMALYAIGCYFLIIFTQTRSAIYGLIPTIFLALMLVEKKRKKFLVVIFGTIFTLLCFSVYQTFVIKFSERSKLKMDHSTYYKITANLYGTYAALYKNPLFGIPRATDNEHRDDYQEAIIEGEKLLGKKIEQKGVNLVATNHNLFGYYARYYGLIGLILLCALIFFILKKINLKNDLQNRFMLYGLIIFFLQYSLLHNSKILQDIVLWTLLSCGKEKS